VKYQNRIAVVTGAGSGIGRALTCALTQDGAHVAASDIDEKGLAETQAACPPGQVTTYQVDVADRDAVLAYADDVRARPRTRLDAVQQRRGRPVRERG
jgi:NAD(P)-dependent dehydrogenase (short-subunit alcohol dehydrogenase family)